LNFKLPRIQITMAACQLPGQFPNRAYDACDAKVTRGQKTKTENNFILCCIICYVCLLSNQLLHVMNLQQRCASGVERVPV
jgi:hypothetical protein